MAEYIERENAIKALMNDAPEQVGYSREDAADCIRYMDAADVVTVRHGSWEEADWIECSTNDLYIRTPRGARRCSECKRCFKKELLWKDNYCPNCGAKMDGGYGNA